MSSYVHMIRTLNPKPTQTDVAYCRINTLRYRDALVWIMRSDRVPPSSGLAGLMCSWPDPIELHLQGLITSTGSDDADGFWLSTPASDQPVGKQGTFWQDSPVINKRSSSDVYSKLSDFLIMFSKL